MVRDDMEYDTQVVNPSRMIGYSRFRYDERAMRIFTYTCTTVYGEKLKGPPLYL